uniref:Uncharacterized protein n=1 Tax=Arundo donax TaxID=35708 RepID=A0A0A9EQU5_ARUDO
MIQLVLLSTTRWTKPLHKCEHLFISKHFNSFLNLTVTMKRS